MAVKVDTWKEIVFGSSDPNISRVLSKKEKDGELRKVAPRIYTTNLIDSLENIVRRNLMDIIYLFIGIRMQLLVIAVPKRCARQRQEISS